MALPWVRLETAWPTNPKFLMLSADKKWHAIAVYMAGLAYSGAQGTDGFLPYFALSAMFGTQREVDELTQVGLWNPCDGGWEINDWDEYQPSSEEHKARSDKARNAALARWHGKNGHRR